MSYVTPWSGQLDPGIYEITVPSSVQVGSNIYSFVQWEDASTNATRTINLVSDMAIQATYALVTVTISVVAGPNGTVSPSGTLILAPGQTYSFAAIPNTGYQLDHWDLAGSNIGSTNPISITATSDMNGKTLTAYFTTVPIPKVTLIVACDATKGTVMPSPGTHQFNVGDTVQFTATSLAGFVFSNWTLDGVVYSVNPLSLPITSAMDGKTLTAVFQVATHILTVYTVPVSSVPFTLDGSSVTSPWSGTLNEGSHTVVMPSSFLLGSDVYSFLKWEYASTNPTRTINLLSDMAITATYVLVKYTLTTRSTPITGVPYTIDGYSRTTPYSESLSPKAYTVTMPSSVQVGTYIYNFSYWEDGSTNPARTLNLVAGMAIQATYAVATITITVTAGAEGTVSPSGMVTLAIGQMYQFAALPSSGYQLGHWDLAGLNIGSSNPISITATFDMNGKVLTALFTTIPIPKITVIVACDTTKGSVTPSVGTHEFNIGDTVQFVATPLARFDFDIWTLDGTIHTGNPLSLSITLSMDGKTLTAIFVVKTHNLTVNTTPSGIPFTVDATSVVSPWVGTLVEGNHTVAMPSNVLVGTDIYNFVQWENGSTSPTRILNLLSDTTITATYELPTPPPPAKGRLSIHAFYDGQEIAVIYEVIRTALGGSTPDIVELDVGTYEVKATKNSEIKTISATVLSEQSVRVDFQFVAPAPTPISPIISFLAPVATGLLSWGLSRRG